MFDERRRHTLPVVKHAVWFTVCVWSICSLFVVSLESDGLVMFIAARI